MRAVLLLRANPTRGLVRQTRCLSNVSKLVANKPMLITRVLQPKPNTHWENVKRHEERPLGVWLSNRRARLRRLDGKIISVKDSPFIPRGERLNSFVLRTRLWNAPWVLGSRQCSQSVLPRIRQVLIARRNANHPAQPDCFANQIWDRWVESRGVTRTPQSRDEMLESGLKGCRLRREKELHPGVGALPRCHGRGTSGSGFRRLRGMAL